MLGFNFSIPRCIGVADQISVLIHSSAGLPNFVAGVVFENPSYQAAEKGNAAAVTE